MKLKRRVLLVLLLIGFVRMTPAMAQSNPITPTVPFLLISPDSSEQLVFDGKNSLFSNDGMEYTMVGSSPVLYPSSIMNRWESGELPLKYYDNALVQLGQRHLQ